MRRADSPWKLAPYPTEVGTAITGRLTSPPMTLARIKSERGIQVDSLAKQFEEAGCSQVTAFDSTKDALEHVLSEKKEEDRLYMVGSLYLIGEILEDLKLRKRG